MGAMIIVSATVTTVHNSRTLLLKLARMVYRVNHDDGDRYRTSGHLN